MGYEIVGRWLQEEVNAQISVINGVLQRLEWVVKGHHPNVGSFFIF
ncbi:YacL family protein [Vibrio sp. S9_S30]|nr:YacL family protein [Vibrio sp. S9_S30]